MAEERASIFQRLTPSAEEVPMDEQTLQELQRMLALDVRQVDAPGTETPCCTIDKL